MGDLAAVNWDTPKLKETEQSLPPELRDRFRSMVESMQFHAVKRGWHPVRQYQVFADMVREGWNGPPCSKQNAPKEA